MGSRGPLVALAALLAGVPIALTAQAPAFDIQLQQADGLIRDGRFTDAAQAYRRLLAGGAEADAVRERARAGLTLSLLRTGDFAGARSEGARLAETPEASPASIALYGDTLWSSGLFDEAEHAYESSLARNPGEPRARHGRARSLTAHGQLTDALVEAQAAVAAAPSEGEFRHLLGVIYERQHRFVDAAAAFAEYVALLPDRDHSPTALWTRAEIRFLHAFDRVTPLAFAGDSASRQVWRVPLRIDKGKVFVRGKVNGGPVDFVLDTGAEQTVLSLEAAARLGVNPVAYTESAGVGTAGRRGLQVGRITRLQVGDLDVHNVPCLIKNPPLGQLPTREPESFSPLALGLSMTIDYARRELLIARALPETPHATELALHVYRLATVRGLVNGTPVSFVVDTGGREISISRATARQLDAEARHIPLRVYGTSGWDEDAFLLPNIDLAFEALHLPRTAVVVLNLSAPSELLGFQVGGIVGHSFLSKYRVTFDLQRSVLGLDPL
jgi:clan AA aspartic protease (TIGR02281 family)